MFDNDISPLFEHKHTEEPVFLPGNMLEAARIQKNLPPLVVPEGCLLDFDGELVDFLVAKSKAKLEPSWPCFHTRLYLSQTAQNMESLEVLSEHHSRYLSPKNSLQEVRTGRHLWGETLGSKTSKGDSTC